MARYTGPSCRLCRREGMKLFLKGERCFSGKCAITRRPTVPGQHGGARTKISEYGLQLREKQKCKRIYGILETQFRIYFERASQRKGVTGENLLTILETRLDNVLYRAGILPSRKQVRQFIRHSHVEIAGKKVNIPSYQVKVGDVITIKENSRKLEILKNAVEGGNTTVVPAWLKADLENLKVEVIALPKREDVDLNIREQLIVEFYSKM